jgi:hypothetical protein
MTNVPVHRRAGLGVVIVIALSGCAKGPPPVTEVSGVVLLEGKPLPQARVEFIPDLSGFGAEMNSSATTDDEGRFSLSMTYKGQPGAVVGKHRVLVAEMPTPGEFRSQDPQTQARYQQFLAKLKNRPIPEAYATIASTPLTVEVKAEQKSYEIQLKRKP